MAGERGKEVVKNISESEQGPEMKEGKELLKAILDPGRTALFTKNSLDKALDELHMVNDGEFEWTFTVTNVDGQTVSTYFPALTTFPKHERIKLVYRSAQQIAYPNTQHDAAEPKYKRCPIAFQRTDEHHRSNDRKPCEESCKAAGKEFKQFMSVWRETPFIQSLVEFIEKNQPHGDNVNKVICFGVHSARNHLQHATAVIIRETYAKLQRKRHNKTEHIKLYVQDPGCCTNGKKYLDEEHDIMWNNGPWDFTYVDQHTFIISRSPGIPFRQMVMDIMAFSKGPAGMLCDVIGEDYLESCPRPDASSIRLCQYKQESLSKVLDDSGQKVPFQDYMLPDNLVCGKVGIYIKNLGTPTK